jgi:hypothetical protein
MAGMPSPDIAAFLRGHFKSVWALELLLFLKDHADVAWPGDALVTALRTSEIIVSMSVATLLAGGLVAEEADGAVRYAPASDDLSRMVDITQALYVRKPNAVRRVIVGESAHGLSAFANSFKLRKD